MKNLEFVSSTPSKSATKLRQNGVHDLILKLVLVKET